MLRRRRRFRQFTCSQLDEVDSLLFGRKTYETLAAYWPTEAARERDPEIAVRMNSYFKFVVSASPFETKWDRTQVIDGAEQIATLKMGDGGDILVHGSSELTARLMQSGLIDELRITINPVALGSGHSVLASLTDSVSLRLIRTTTFSACGKVLLVYTPSAAGSNHR